MIKVAVLKPDHGPIGGFERVVYRIEEILEGAGFDVTRHTVDLVGIDAIARSRSLEGRVIDSQREFLTYLHGRDRFDGISTSVYDLVISTSPPSYTHRHRAHLALFYHHHRIFYDLEAEYIAAGFAADGATHTHAAGLVRGLDRDRLDAVTTFLCPSQSVASRLKRFNGRDHTFPFQAGMGIELDRTQDNLSLLPGTPRPKHGALCVSRHEFPKRVELLVAAAHLLDEAIPVTVTGTGGRLAYARDLDRRITTGTATVETSSDADLWCNTGVVPQPDPGDAGLTPNPPGRVNFLGYVDDLQLVAEYSSARCVVAPAYQEDYGLTAIEAMHHGCPVIVCDDGGGLAELVDDGETGLIVEPTPSAIAAAIERLHDDPDLAHRLGETGYIRASDFTWSHAADQLLTAVEATLDLAS